MATPSGWWSGADGAFLGMCGMAQPRDPLVEYEVGWRLARHAWGRGYAQEAARATLDWAWAHRAMPTIVAITVPDNRASWTLMERIGMTRRAEDDFEHPSLPEGHPCARTSSIASSARQRKM
jgi:RimJ/RimL family protein N-acetyltransferase